MRERCRWRRSKCGLLAATAAMATAGCAPANSVEGSVTEILTDMMRSYADCRALEREKDPPKVPCVDVYIDPGSTLAVAYTKPQGEGKDILFKMSVRLAKVTLDAQNKSADLAPDFDGVAKAVCTRAVTDDPRRVLAPAKIGTFTVDQEPQANRPLSGTWRVTLGQGGDVGQGRTAFGTYSTLEVLPAVGL